jgi:hypothetical protein
MSALKPMPDDCPACGARQFQVTRRWDDYPVERYDVACQRCGWATITDSRLPAIRWPEDPRE